MGKKELSGRNNWERESGVKASAAEQNLYSVFRHYFEGTTYVLHEKPKHLKNLYASVQLSAKEKQKIYNPQIDLSRVEWGVSPDFAIENTANGKILFGEIKR